MVYIQCTKARRYLKMGPQSRYTLQHNNTTKKVDLLLFSILKNAKGKKNFVRWVPNLQKVFYKKLKVIENYRQKLE